MRLLARTSCSHHTRQSKWLPRTAHHARPTFAILAHAMYQRIATHFAIHAPHIRVVAGMSPPIYGARSSRAWRALPAGAARKCQTASRAFDPPPCSPLLDHHRQPIPFSTAAIAAAPLVHQRFSLLPRLLASKFVFASAGVLIHCLAPSFAQNRRGGAQRP